MEERLKIVDGVLQGGGGFPVVRRGGALPLPRATARVAPTKALQEVRYKPGRADVGIGPYEWVVGADDPVRPVPITQHLVGQGPCALPGAREKSGRGPSRTPAPKKVYLVVRRGGALPLPRATARVAPTECLPIEFRRGRRPRRPAPVTRGAVPRAKTKSPPAFAKDDALHRGTTLLRGLLTQAAL